LGLVATAVAVAVAVAVGIDVAMPVSVWVWVAVAPGDVCNASSDAGSMLLRIPQAGCPPNKQKMPTTLMMNALLFTRAPPLGSDSTLIKVEDPYPKRGSLRSRAQGLGDRRWPVSVAALADVTFG
jgi:hypothetical protein